MKAMLLSNGRLTICVALVLVWSTAWELTAGSASEPIRRDPAGAFLPANLLDTPYSARHSLLVLIPSTASMSGISPPMFSRKKMPDAT